MTRIDLQATQREGWRANLAFNKPLAANPYTVASEAWRAWNDGWERAEQHRRAQPGYGED